MLPPILPAQRTAVAIDFDGVCFDSRKFLLHLAERIEYFHGIPRENFLSLYFQASDMEKADMNPTIEHFSRLIQPVLSGRCFGEKFLTPEEVLDYLVRTTGCQAGGFFFPDAFMFCESLLRFSDKIVPYIMTRGNADFQLAKINAIGLVDYFRVPEPAAEPMRSRILITRDTKGPYIHELAKNYDRVIFFDDLLGYHREVSDFMERFGRPGHEVHHVWVNRTGEPLPDDCRDIFKNLQVLHFVPLLMPHGLKLIQKLLREKP